MKKLVAVLFVALAFSLFGCKGPEGPVGPAGTAGKDGQNAGFVYFEGFKDSLKCASCHNPDNDSTYYMKGRAYQWNQSKHALGGDNERNGENCAACHTTEGFMEYAKKGFVSQVVTPQLRPSPPGCFACHSPHSKGNFSLRDTAATVITSFVEGVSNQTFNYGRGNLCVKCHQTRTASPMSPKPNPAKTAATDTISITSSRWYPHYGVQGQMLMGKGGFEFASGSYGTSTHTNAIKVGCPQCHMVEMAYATSTPGVLSSGGTGKAGGHTMNISYESNGVETFLLTSCNTTACHNGNLKSIDYKGATTIGLNLGAQTTIKRYLDTLSKLIMTDTTTLKKWNAGGKKTPWITMSVSSEGDTSYTVNASTSSPLKIVPAAKAGALFNFLFVEHDKSEGMHNTRYAVDVLKASIDELRK